MPDAAEIERRKARWFVPYHEALSAELERLRGVHDQVVLYDAHSIRSSIPRLFEGILPHFNIGTNGGASCAPELTAAVEAACDATSFSRVTNGRFRGGWITRHHGKPQAGVHAIQMELACRSYLPEPIGRVDETNWPPPFDDLYAAPMTAALERGFASLRSLCGTDQPRSTPMTRIDKTRVIRAPRGTARSAKSWQTEAALRMLMNNLDAEVAERPEELVVYGGIGRAARDWESFDRIVETLRRLEDDQTLLVQSGKPVGVFRTHADAPRVLIANSNLVPAWANWDHFHELDRKGLMMYGQMTAGSWIYIGTPGNRARHLRDVRRSRSTALRRRFRRTMDPDRGPGRNGRRPASGGGDGRRLVPGRRMPALPHRDAAEDRLPGPPVEQPG